MNAEQTRKKRIAPYMAIGLSVICRAIAKRSEAMDNMRNIENLIHRAMFIISIGSPVKIIAISEGAISGIGSEMLTPDHVTFSRKCAIEIPGEETDFLGELARQYRTYIIAQAKANWPEVIKDRFFNTVFIIDPQGKVVHKYAKNHVFPREHSCTPHDIYDIWVKKFGDGIASFYPVCKTEDIGNIGTGVCNDGVVSEWSRALALNGAEVLYRPTFPQPFAGAGLWEVQNRAHALFNNCYLIAPQAGYAYYPGGHDPVDVQSGGPHIVDYLGRTVSHSASATNTMVAALIDIEQLRNFREMALWGNWVKDLRTETFKGMYAQPIHPKNLFMDREPLKHAEHDDVYRDNIRRLFERGTYTPPAEHFEGAQFVHYKRDR